VVVWGTLIQPSYHLRLAAMVLVMVGLNGTQLGLFLHHGIRHVSTCFIALVLSVQLLVLLLRGATIYWPGHETLNVFSATVPQVLFVGTVNLSNMLMAVGFVMLATHRLNLELAWFASRDPLTGLLNRRAFTSSFEQAREDARQAGKALALMILDLDHFKHINDHYGHAVGDLVLVDFCRRVDRVLSEAVPFARIGGEEFAVILRGLKQQEVLSCAERIRDAVAQHEGVPLPLYTCSIGIASMAGEVESLEQLIRAADGALYRAKCAGRNRVEVALAQS